MIVKIVKLDHQGRGIAYLDKPVFVDNVLVDEIVDIKIISEHKKYALGKVIKYIERSSKRVKPLCKYYGICGGCHLMHMSYDDQLIYKKNKIKEIINKFYKNDIKINNIISGNNLHYRNKATFKVDKAIGFYKIRSNEVVDIDKCIICDDRINDFLASIKNKKIPLKEIVVRSKTNGIDGNIIKLNNYSFYVSDDSFFQVNNEMTIRLYDKVLEYLDLNKNDKVLDLYCGVGSIGIYISENCKYVYGVEINESAINNANKNKELNHISNISFKCLASKYIDILNYDTNKVVVDPPRSGLDLMTVNHLINHDFDKIVYVSCNPVTLARDLKLLSVKYDTIEITPVDMFPNTYHVECVCVLCLR